MCECSSVIYLPYMLAKFVVTFLPTPSLNPAISQIYKYMYIAFFHLTPKTHFAHSKLATDGFNGHMRATYNYGMNDIITLGATDVCLIDTSPFHMYIHRRILYTCKKQRMCIDILHWVSIIRNRPKVQNMFS